MAQGLSKGERPSWSTPAGRAGGSTMAWVSERSRARPGSKARKTKSRAAARGRKER